MANQETNQNYESIDRPYNSLLERSVLNVGNNSNNTTDQVNSTQNSKLNSLGNPTPTTGTGTGTNGNVETMPVKSDGSMGDVWIKNFIKSENWQPKTVGFYINGQTGYAEFTNVYVSGNIQALTGSIGGWIINATSISDTLGLTGMSSNVTGGDDVRFWAGNVTPTSAPFRVTESGALTASSATITGSITATSGAIGGWVVDATSIKDVAGTVGLSSAVTGGDDIRFFAGNVTPSSAPFRVTEAGVITATSGQIGSWTLGSTTITGTGITLSNGLADAYISFGVTPPAIATIGTGIFIDKTGLYGLNANTQNLKIDATNGYITAIAGTVGGNVLSSTSIGSTTFVSGPLGSGWNISNTGTAEFQNVVVRGVIRTSVFEKDTVSAVNGMLLVSKADVLSSDMTALDSSTLTISGESSFVINEVLRIKDGADDEWLLVTSVASAPTYGVTRDLASSYPPNTNPIWKKGTTVVSTGVGTGTKTGYVLLDSSSLNSPFIDIYGRNSNTYTDTTLHGRFGWLKGITDADVGLAANDVWGLYTDNAYLKGNIVANAGYIGGITGWVITSNYIKDVAGVTGMSSVVTAGDDVRFWAGHATPTSAPFRVTEAGVLTASSATITGAITATSGAIGGWVVTTSDIKDAAGVVGMSSTVTGGDDIRFFAGNATPASAPFRVTEAGVLTASSATITGSITATSGAIGGWVVTTSDIKDASGTVGMSSTVTGGDDIRFFAGNATPASAPFRVTEAGSLYASNATISGSITATTGDIGGFSVGSDYIRDAANSFGLASTVTTGTDIRFWAGDTFANRATAPLTIDEAGNITANSLRRKDFHLFSIFESMDGYSKSADGTGSFVLNQTGITSLTGAVNGNNNEVQKQIRSSSSAFTWDKSRSAKFCFLIQGNVTNQTLKICTGLFQSDTNTHIGFKAINGTVTGSVANGTTESTVSLGYITNNFFYVFEFFYNQPLGVVYFYINGSLGGSLSTNIPTGTGSAPYILDWHWKTTTNAAKEMELSWFDVWQGN